MTKADSQFHFAVSKATDLADELSTNLTPYLEEQDKLIAERNSAQASLLQIDENI